MPPGRNTAILTRQVSWPLIDWVMAFQLFTRRDAIRHTAGRVAVAVSLTVVLTLGLLLMAFGADPDAIVRAGFVFKAVLCIAIVIAALLTAGLSYRSALMMQELTLTRAELLRISCTDQLTGLLNRRGFDAAASALLVEACEANAPVVALMCDIDHFKSINDRYGHEFGDKVLIRIGDVLRAFADANAILIARHGGEEFAALLVGVNAEQAMIYAETLRRLCSIEVPSEGASVHVTVSVGLTSPQRETDLSTIMRCADQALYAAKELGRNRVERVDVLSDLIAA